MRAKLQLKGRMEVRKEGLSNCVLGNDHVRARVQLLKLSI